jgi:hypothetical protein
MWIDVIGAVLFEKRFDLQLGDMNYVVRNMIAKYVSSASRYSVSKGVESLIDDNPTVFGGLSTENSNNLKNLFYGGKSEASKIGKPTMFEHSVPAVIVRDQLLQLRSIEIPNENKQQFTERVRKVLLRSGRVVVVLKEENSRLSRKHMPTGWDYFSGDDLERYRHAKPPVCISSKYIVPRDKHICR